MQRLLEKILGWSFLFICKQICVSQRILLYNFISAWLHAKSKRKKKTRLLTLNFLRIRELVLVVIVKREIKTKIPIEDETNIVPLFSINLFHATGLFLSLLKTPGFLMFSGDIEETSGIKRVNSTTPHQVKAICFLTQA